MHGGNELKKRTDFADAKSVRFFVCADKGLFAFSKLYGTLKGCIDSQPYGFGKIG